MITHPETSPAQWGLTLITIFGEQCHPSEPTVRPLKEQLANLAGIIT